MGALPECGEKRCRPATADFPQNLLSHIRKATLSLLIIPPITRNDSRCKKGKKRDRKPESVTHHYTRRGHVAEGEDGGGERTNMDERALDLLQKGLSRPPNIFPSLFFLLSSSSRSLPCFFLSRSGKFAASPVGPVSLPNLFPTFSCFFLLFFPSLPDRAPSYEERNKLSECTRPEEVEKEQIHKLNTLDRDKGVFENVPISSIILVAAIEITARRKWADAGSGNREAQHSRVVSCCCMAPFSMGFSPSRITGPG